MREGRFVTANSSLLKQSPRHHGHTQTSFLSRQPIGVLSRRVTSSWSCDLTEGRGGRVCSPTALNQSTGNSKPVQQATGGPGNNSEAQPRSTNKAARARQPGLQKAGRGPPGSLLNDLKKELSRDMIHSSRAGELLERSALNRSNCCDRLTLHTPTHRPTDN